ncbi:O-antigen ligase family protein [Psychroserpens sp.]|uniref:O-antigen ligase family protein n=1 Tax=Psychroserpens sp. TaxID=2020870 RepID=UPI002B272AFB|nr:O-antigen ligase family protein [Psychroserpens sp.]
MLKESSAILKEILFKKDLSFLAFTLSIFLLPISINFSTFSLILSIALKLIQVALKRDKLFASKALKHSAIIGLCFFAYIEVNSILQTDIYHNFLHFEQQYMHFALFFIAPILLRNKSENKLLMYALFLGVATAILYVFFSAIVHNLTFDKYTFEKQIDLHHTYLSMFILTFVNYSVVQKIIRKTDTSIALKVLYVFLAALSLAIMYLLDSKVSVFIFLFLFLIHSLPELSKKNTGYYIVFLVLILIVISAFINKVNVNYESALDFRLQIWEASFKAFENNPIFGNLTSPEKDILNYNHYLNGKYYYLDSDLNSHNQFLSILMRFGFFGFLILFLFIINIFRKVNPRTKKLDIREGFGFFIIVLMVFYIENILDRHHGIVYTTLFYNYYLVALENAER